MLRGDGGILNHQPPHMDRDALSERGVQRVEIPRIGEHLQSMGARAAVGGQLKNKLAFFEFDRGGNQQSLGFDGLSQVGSGELDQFGKGEVDVLDGSHCGWRGFFGGSASGAKESQGSCQQGNVFHARQAGRFGSIGQEAVGNGIRNGRDGLGPGGVEIKNLEGSFLVERAVAEILDKDFEGILMSMVPPPLAFQEVGKEVFSQNASFLGHA